MEVWKDYQTGKFVKLNLNSGKHSPTNKYGSDKKAFLAYITGYPRAISPKPIPLDETYSIQPKKFDGYCQFPRPFEKSMSKLPYSRQPLKETSKIYIKHSSKIPNPLSYLHSPQISPRSTSPIRRYKKNSQSLGDSLFKTIDDLKNSFIQLPTTNIKTINDLHTKLEFEKNASKGFIPPILKEKRRKLKGKFLI